MWKNKDAVRRMGILLFVCVPLISAILFCAVDGRRISDVYIPLGGWSDEIGYYKQVEGILSHGLPRGYFGYNQSRALYGSLGSWGIAPLIPYVIWGFFFGWSYSSPIYANIFFGMAAFMAFYGLLRPRAKQMCILSFFWAANQFLNRYVLSGVVEAAIILELMIVIACGERLLPGRMRPGGESGKAAAAEGGLQGSGGQRAGKETAAMVCCTALTCLLTLARPYFAVFFLIPLWKALRDGKKRWLAALPCVAAGTIVLFFVNRHYFCAPYFSETLPFDQVISGGIGVMALRLFEGLLEIAKLIWYAMRYSGVGVGWYYLLLGTELTVMSFFCIWSKHRRKTVPPMFLVALTGEILILCSLIELYDLGEGARHILSLIVVNAALLAVEIPSFGPGGALAAICILSLLRTQGADAPPWRDEAYAAYMEALRQDFQKVVTLTEEISYDNVVTIPTADRDDSDTPVSPYYGVMFALPAGAGISLDFPEYYDAPENIKAGYVLVHPKGQIRKKLEAIGMVCVLEREELALYARKGLFPAGGEPEEVIPAGGKPGHAAALTGGREAQRRPGTK